MEKHLALESLINITNSKIGYTPSTPTEFNEISMLIYNQTGRSLSLSTIKRIWGYVKYDNFPSMTTLNAIAQYNGFRSWDTFLTSTTYNCNNDSGFINETLVTTDMLQPGDRIQLEWHDGKECEIECVSHMRFRMNSSTNIKLIAGDTFTLHTVCVGHPIYVRDIKRGDIHIPAYIGAKHGGVTNIRVIPCPKPKCGTC